VLSCVSSRNVFVSFPHKRESRDMRGLSAMDSCLLRRLLSFRRNDNLASTGTFGGLAERLQRHRASTEETTPISAI